MGIGLFLKELAPLTLYVSGWFCAFTAGLGHKRLALMLVAFLLPLRNVVERIQPYPLGTQFIDILLIGVIIGSIISQKSTGDQVLEKSPITPVAMIMVIYMLFSLFRSDLFLFGSFNFDLHDSRVQDWKNFALMPLLFYLNFKNNVDKKQVWMMFSVMCFTIFLGDFYIIHQISIHPTLVDRDQLRGTFQFLGPNEVAAFLNECTIILMSVLYATKNFRNKSLLLLVILISLYCITFLYSRGAYAGLMVGMFVLFSFKDKKLLIPLILILMLWQVILPQNVINRIKETTETGSLDESSQRRIDIWQQALDYAKANPLVGIGFGSFRNLGLDLKDTHNIYIKILTEQGVIGFIIFLILIFVFLKSGWQLYRHGDDNLSKSLGLGFVCCIFVLLVNNLFGDRWSYLEPNAYLWIFAGLVARLNVIAKATSTKEEIIIIPPEPVAVEDKLLPSRKKARYYDPQ